MEEGIQNRSTSLASWSEGPESRGTLTIVWSCVITIFACTWTVLHLNIPGRGESAFRVTLRKVKWMAITVLFPELIFAKAVCDLRLALEELRNFDEKLQLPRSRQLCQWTIQNAGGLGTNHQWSWEFKYPRGAQWLYRLLGLQPPPRAPQASSQSLPLHEPIEQGIELESQRNTNSRTQSSAEGPSSSARQNLDTTSSRTRGGGEIGHAQPPQSATWRTVQRWTVVHSYYAQMGGIQYQARSLAPNLEPVQSPRGEPEYLCLTGSMLTNRYTFLGTQDPFSHLILTDKDIEDKSKSDWVLKGIAVAQVSWLIMSVIARRIMHLPITQLEIATVSFSAIAILSYIANWWKPKDICHPTILQTPVYGRINTSTLPLVHPQSFMLRLRSPIEAKRKAENIDDELTRVPNDLVWMEGHSPIMFVLMAVSSLGFGGLHCLAWDFTFPSAVESLAWRISSVISAVLPVLTLGISLALHFMATSNTDFQLLSALSRKLEPLKELDQYYWNLLENAHWKNWDSESKRLLFRSPQGSRDWNIDPSTEPRSQQQRSEANGALEWDFEEYGSRLLMFTATLKGVKILTPQTAHALCNTWFRQGRGLNPTPEVLDFWEDYEENFIRRDIRHRIPGTGGGTCISFIQQTLDETKRELPQWVKIEQIVDKTSFILTIIGGMIYIIARLVILVLLFTCLREVPKDVYRIPRWVNLLPHV